MNTTQVNSSAAFQVYTVECANGKIKLMEVHFRNEVLGDENVLVRYDVVVDEGDEARIEGNFVALRQGEEFQLYCYADDKLNKGGRCTRYLIHPWGFIYEGLGGTWYRSEHNCTKISELGTFYNGGVWVKNDGKRPCVSYLKDNVWVSTTYYGFEHCDAGNFEYYCFKKRNGSYDVIMRTYNYTLCLYPAVAKEIVQQLVDDPEASVDRGECEDLDSFGWLKVNQLKKW